MTTINLEVITATDGFLSEGIASQVSLDGGEWQLAVVNVPIIEGVSITVYDQSEAVLNIGNQSLDFKWTEEAAQMFLEIDSVEPIELLEMIYRLQLGASA